MSQTKLFSEKCHRYGVLGAGLIPDSLATLKLAEVKDEPVVEPADDEPAPSRVSEVSLLTLPTTLGPDGKPSREQILEILNETVRVQGIVQQEVSVLARKLAKEGQKDGKKKKKVQLSFTDGHSKIQALNLPKEPLEQYGLSENAFQKIVLQYEEDGEVMECAQKLLHPAGKGDPERAKGITMDKIIEIHRFMVGEMQKVLTEFLELPQETRRSFTGKGCETTAELLVSIAVEQQLSVRCEDVEQAVIRYEEELQAHQEFSRYTDQLANMMQHLIGAAQPRVAKEEFVSLIKAMGDSTKKAKAFAKKLYEDYRAKTTDIKEAYVRFAEFSEEQARLVGEDDLPDLGSVELQLCYDEYKEDEEVRKIWAESGVESNLMMQASMGPMMMGPGGSPKAGSLSPVEGPKGKKLKSSEVVEMQELMVDEMKRTTQDVMFASREKGAKAEAWRAEITVQLVQALASAAVERRYGVSAEEMTLAGFQHAAQLQKNERFAKASEKQQEILMMLARLCGQDGK